MSAASSAYSDSEVESDDQGSIFSTLSRNKSFLLLHLKKIYLEL